MALGGVATGSMNAMEAASAAVAMSSRGSMPRPAAAPAMTGMAMLVVATLEVSSVRKTMSVATAATTTQVGTEPSVGDHPADPGGEAGLLHGHGQREPTAEQHEHAPRDASAVFQSRQNSPLAQLSGGEHEEHGRGGHRDGGVPDLRHERLEARDGDAAEGLLGAQHPGQRREGEDRARQLLPPGGRAERVALRLDDGRRVAVQVARGVEHAREQEPGGRDHDRASPARPRPSTARSRSVAPSSSLAAAARTALGGVPMSVATPPSEAA